MIQKLFNHPHLLHQTSAESVPEPPIAAHIDSCGLILLSQEGRDHVINPESVPEMCKLLRTMKDLAEGKQ